MNVIRGSANAATVENMSISTDGPGNLTPVICSIHATHVKANISAIAYSSRGALELACRIPMWPVEQFTTSAHCKA